MLPLKVRENQRRHVGRKHLVQHGTKFRPHHFRRGRHRDDGSGQQNNGKDAENGGVGASARQHQNVIAEAVDDRSS